MAQVIPIHLQFPIPALPPHLEPQNLVNAPRAITFDIYLQRSIALPPNGWGSHRSYIYRKLRRLFIQMGFEPSQYSDYTHHHCTAAYCWNSMFALMNVEPPGRMETTIRRLRMASVLELHVQDVSEAVQLGGVFSRRICGPIPRGLVEPVEDDLEDAPLELPAGHPLPPEGTIITAAALNPANWVT